MNKSVLITGATRGLGANLARQFAQRGYKLALTGRNIEELEKLGAQLQQHSAQVCLRRLDVADFETVPAVIRECAEELGGIDIVIVNAGIALVTKVGEGKGYGQLVGISSIAALRGTRGQGAYSASKAGFSKYLESVRCETADEPVVVTELAPGYIDTDLNRSIAKRPFVVSAEKGTRIMADLIERQVGFRYVPPWPWTLVAQFMKLLPISVLRKM
jgi:short-subunit dehydrogenase